MSEFRVQEHGFQIVMDNDYTVSVQFSDFHHCSNRHEGRSDTSQCGNAEVAVIDPDENFVALSEYDDVVGYQSVSEVIAIINKFNDM